MKLRPTYAAATFALLLPLAAAPAQEAGNWRATNSSARTITGDIALAANAISINLASFPISEIRALKPEELAAAFDADANSPSVGKLFRVNIPAAHKFLHKNSICGSDDAQWMASFQTGRTLSLAFFSGATPPALTLDAPTDNRCGTFAFSR